MAGKRSGRGDGKWQTDSALTKYRAKRNKLRKTRKAQKKRSQ